MAKTLTLEILTAYREHAIKAYLDLPARSRIPGMVRDLTAAESVEFCQLQAAVTVLNQMGLLSELPGLLTYTHTTAHGLIDNETGDVSESRRISIQPQRQLSFKFSS